MYIVCARSRLTEIDTPPMFLLPDRKGIAAHDIAPASTMI